ncbi:MAG: GTP-binding protein [Candidatus Hodgkinia cicadicola]
MKRSFRALDGAVIMLDVTAVVELQTEAIWFKLSRYGLARLIFCSKLDKFGSDYNLRF